MTLKKKTGTIALGTIRVIEFASPSDESFTIQLLSSDLSADTTFTLEQSMDGTNWDVSEESGTEISETLSQATTYCKSFDCDAGVYFRINFAGSTTGDVDYVINI